jgi:NitT/TauT family transport system substrate-binding protein
MPKKRLLPFLALSALVLSSCGSDGEESADGPTKITYVYCADTLSPSGAPFWIGDELGYFAEENIELEVIPVAGGTGACLQLLAAGRADISAPSPDVVLSAAAGGQELGLTYFYEIAPSFLFDATVTPDSDVESFADLEGATIGLASLGGSFELFVRAGLTDAGVDPDSVEMVAVGTEAAAAESLENGDIDALVINDVRYAALEQAGYTFRYLDKPDVTDRMFGAGLLARDAWLEEEPEAAEGYARAYAKSVLFAQENPEAAIKIHWDMYPQFAPTEDLDAAMTATLPVLERRLDQIEDDGSDEHPFGEFTEDSWDAYVEFLGLTDSIDDVTDFYTNDVTAEIGDIDIDEVQESARTWSPK